MDTMNVALADQEVETGIVTPLPAGILGRHRASDGRVRWAYP